MQLSNYARKNLTLIGVIIDTYRCKLKGQKMLNLSSKITKKLLGYFFLHEDESLYFNEIVRRLKEDKRNFGKNRVLHKMKQDGFKYLNTIA